MISSAVIVPSADQLSPQSTSQKRGRSSSCHSDHTKRARIAENDKNDERKAPVASAIRSHPPLSPRKASTAQDRAAEERKRGKRLFGALLGTLSQSSTSSAQKRRADIEKKQLGKLQQRDEEAEDEKRRKRGKLDAIRQREQRVWNERSMQLRHKNMLAEAQFLRTTAEPVLFFKPWELRSDEGARIRTQIQHAEESIRTELAAHKSQLATSPRRGNAEDMPNAPSAAGDDHLGKCQSAEREDGERGGEEDGEGGKTADIEAGMDEKDKTDHLPAASSDGPVQAETNDGQNTNMIDQKGHVAEDTSLVERHGEDHGAEELVEGQEDDVIY